MNTRTLVGLPYSPWSCKAQWALDVSGVDYAYETYVPMVGERALKKRLGKGARRVTVPVLFDEGGPYTDSLQIARRAAALAAPGKPNLFPEAHTQAIETWNARSETALQAARSLLTIRVRRDPEALKEMVPKQLIGVPLVGGALGRYGVKWFTRKYRLEQDEDGPRGAVRGVLDTFSAQLEGKRYLLGELSYADLAIAVVLHAVRPPDRMPLGPATFRCWHDPPLIERYPELLEWRDELIARHVPHWGQTRR